MRPEKKERLHNKCRNGKSTISMQDRPLLTSDWKINALAGEDDENDNGWLFYV
jgi:hypothetical protein